LATQTGFYSAATILVAGLALLFMSSAARAADPQAAFDELFGREYKQATATPDRADDAALAARLLKAATDLEGPADLKSLLFEKAYDLALDNPATYATAFSALDGLEKTNPDFKAAIDERRLNVAKTQYQGARAVDEKIKAGRLYIDLLMVVADAKTASGNYADAHANLRLALAVADAVKSDRKEEIADRLKRIWPRVAAAQQVETLKARLQADPADKATADAILRLYLVDLDNPAEAAKYADASGDETMKKYLLVAAMHAENLPEKACLALGNWYKDLASAAGPTRAPMLQRAQTYYASFLAAHTTEDADRSAAAAALDKVTRDLEGIAAVGWIDLLKLVDPAKDAVSAAWRVEGGILISGSSDTARLRLPYQPPEEYDVQAVFSRQTGSGDVGLLLFKAGTQFEWIMDVGGERCGFEAISGQRVNAAKNPTGFTQVLKNGQRYTVLVQVRNTGLKAFLNGKLVAELKTDYKNLAAMDGFAIPGTRCLGLVTWNSATAFQTLRVLEVTGKGKVGRDPPPKAGS
jgi:hypothetical protein